MASSSLGQLPLPPGHAAGLSLSQPSLKFKCGHMVEFWPMELEQKGWLIHTYQVRLLLLFLLQHKKAFC